MSNEVRHNPSARRFESGEARTLAVCEYVESGTDLVITHTFVPSELRGGGIAARLVDAAAAYAAERGLRPVGACSYAAARLSRSNRATS